MCTAVKRLLKSVLIRTSIHRTPQYGSERFDRMPLAIVDTGRAQAF